MAIAKWLGGLFFGLLIVTGPARAEMDDRTFMTRAMEINLAEIAIGKLGLDKAKEEAVRAYAEKMVAEHTRANEKAIALAQQLDVAAPIAPSDKDQAEYAKLQRIDEGFDKAFMDVMIKGHQEAINLFDAQANGKGPAAEFAKAMLPKLQEHLQQAQSWQGS
ncbi:DUF4142 domain-containing protein [Rhodoligotrophos ferricapiens]|uniref:DUF4142 domain-containing protein n=1 Tax=Rhodoligotrophos ferricapiens TaxID=3069264 RepID=UPI00315D07AE